MGPKKKIIVGSSPFDEIGGLLTLQIVDDLLVFGTERLHHEVALQTGSAEGVAAFRVQRVDQRLTTNLKFGRVQV